MPRIKIKDLPKDVRVTEKEMAVIRGGFIPGSGSYGINCVVLRPPISGGGLFTQCKK